MNEHDSRPTHLDLFSGIGGFALAARWAGFRTVGFCEIEPYAQRVLAKNFLADCASTGLERAAGESLQRGSERPAIGSPRIFSDIRTLDGAEFPGVDLITGGFPCQPFSCAGKRRGTADDRHLWPEMLRVIAEARPAWVLGENVAGIINMELDTVLSDLEGIGYACRTFVIPACGVDARHRRNRVWIVAYDHSSRLGQGNEEDARASSEQSNGTCIQCPDVSDSGGARLQGQLLTGSDDAEGWQEQDGRPAPSCGLPCRWKPESQWFAESGMGRVVTRVSNRVDRLRGLGNAIVPQVAFQILREIRGLIQD